LLLDENLNLKIADFGFSAPLDGTDRSGYLTTLLGTLNYMAPEILLGMPYKGMSVDIFSCAVILFVMVTNAFPFNKAAPDDKFYVLLANHRADLFWHHQMKLCN